MLRNVDSGAGTASEITVQSYDELVQRFTKGEIPLGIVPGLIRSLGLAEITISAFMPDFTTFQEHFFNDMQEKAVEDPSKVLGGSW